MTASNLVRIADAAQLLTIVCSIIGFLPQIEKLIRTRVTAGMALRSWMLWWFGSLIALFYALVHYSVDSSFLTLVITAAFSFVLNLITLVLIWIYQCKQPDQSLAKSSDQPSAPRLTNHPENNEVARQGREPTLS